MPALARLARTSAVGALSVKAGPAVSCAADGLLTLAAGARATAYDTRCGAAPTNLPDLVKRNRASREQADLTALGRSLTRHGDCLTATGPLASLVTGRYDSGSTAVAPSTPGSPSPAPPCAVTVLTSTGVGGSGAARRSGASDADSLVARADAARPAGSTLLVLGISEAAGDDVAHLHVALAAGPGFPTGALVSSSTRRDGYVQLIDVAPTLLQLVGATVPTAISGQPFRVQGADPTRAQLIDVDLRATVQKRVTVPWFVVTIGVVLLLLAARRTRRTSAVAAVALPASSFLAGLIPWWRAAHPLLALLGVTGGLSLVLGLAAVSLARYRRTPDEGWAAAAGLCALTALVLIGDLLTGAHLQITSVTGYSPLVAGRFAGIGNVAFGVYAAAGLLATGWLARGRLWVVVVCGLLLVAVDGAPPWGSDVGGVLALLPALVLLGLLVTGRRVSSTRLGLAGLAGATLVTAAALLDHTRGPTAQTHLGRFVTQVEDGSARGVLQRKADAVLGLLFHSPVTALLPLVVAGAVYLLLRPPPALRDAFTTATGLRHGLVALSLACALGFALNDSGAAVPALALLVALPVATAASARPG